MRKLMNWVGLSVSLLGAGQAFAGAGSSGGSDNFAEDAGAAWFLGSERRINACIEIAPDFGISKSYAKQAIEQAFHTWRAYVREKLPREDLGIAMQVSVSETCTGQDDIVFYLGVMTDEVREAWGKRSNPTAFAYRRSYDRKAGWGQGWIWVASESSVFPNEKFPKWSSEAPPALQNLALDQILIHEIGHVLGVPHVEGTIMSERISEKLRISYLTSPRIDHSRELLLCTHCSFDRNGRLGGDLIEAAPGSDFLEARKREIREKFRLLMGREAKSDDIRASIRSEKMERLFLVVSDPEGAQEFEVRFPVDRISSVNQLAIADSAPVFKRMLPPPPVSLPDFAGLPYKAQGTIGHVVTGTVTTRSGKPLMVLVEVNLPTVEHWSLSPSVPPGMGRTALPIPGLRIKMFHEGALKTLFQTWNLQLFQDPIHSEPAQP